MSDNVDSVLWGIIVVLLLVVVWKWYNQSCDEDMLTLTCGCKKGRCRCRGMASKTVQRKGYCQGGDDCDCGCPPMECDCPRYCNCQKNAQGCGTEGMSSNEKALERVSGKGADTKTASQMTQDYSAVTKSMALESGSDGPKASHDRWCESLAMSGMSTGASACSVLEETGRSYGSSDYVGLTARKFCKARQLAAPADDARQTSSYGVEEHCDIDMNELI